MDLEQELEDYRAYLQLQERSEGTVQKYLRDLARYFRETDQWMDHAAVVQWRDGLVAKGYAAVSVNAMLAAVNGYFVFRRRRDCCARPLRVQRKAFCDPERELDRGEYLRLLQAARNGKQKRLLLILQTLASTGIRVSELRHITVEAVAHGHASVQCKGKCREVFLPQKLCRKLKQWCSSCKIQSGCVFVTRSGHPVDRSNLWREMKALCKQAGVAENKVFPHNLRHLFARAFYKIEKNLSKLADLLGHSSIETTRIYIMESGREHQRLMEQMHLLL